jgi:hypothetical protein
MDPQPPPLLQPLPLPLLAHQGLAPPGAPVDSRCPLADYVLPDAGGLAGALLSFLTPLGARGLRAACRAGRAAVAAHRWDAALDVVCPDPFDAESSKLLSDVECLRRPWGTVTTGRGLRRWLACHPCARTLVLGRGWYAYHDQTLDVGVAALAGSAVTRLHVVSRNDVTAAGLQPVLPQLVELALVGCTSLGSSAWAGVSPRLQRLIARGTGDVVDDDLAPLARAAHVALYGPGVRVTSAGVAAHLARSVTRLELGIDTPEFDGGGLAACTRLEALSLFAYGNPVPITGGPLAAGCAHSLKLLYLDGVVLPASWLAGLRVLMHAHISAAEGLTDAAWDGTPSLTHLQLTNGLLAGLLGARLPLRLAVLRLDCCPHFVGAGLAGCPDLEELEVFDGEAFDPGAAALAALPHLRQLRVKEAALLTDDAVAAAPGLVELELTRCPGVAGEELAPLARSLRVLYVDECEGFSGGGLPCLGSLERLYVFYCRSLQLRALVAAAHACPRLAIIHFHDSLDGDSDVDSDDEYSAEDDADDDSDDDDDAVACFGPCRDCRFEAAAEVGGTHWRSL